MSTAVVLSGGGAKGVGQVEALRVLHKQTDLLNDLSVVAGTSTGAINGAALAEGGADKGRREAAMNKLDRVWSDVAFDDVYAGGLSRCQSCLRDTCPHRARMRRASIQSDTT